MEKIKDIAEYINQIVIESEVDWQSIAEEIVLKEKKNQELTYPLRSKIFSKLVSRGFSIDIINAALNKN